MRPRKRREKTSDAAFLYRVVEPTQKKMPLPCGDWIYTFHLASGIRYHCLISLFVFFFFSSLCALNARFICLLNCFSLRNLISQYTTVINWLKNAPTRICGQIPNRNISQNYDYPEWERTSTCTAVQPNRQFVAWQPLRALYWCEKITAKIWCFVALTFVDTIANSMPLYGTIILSILLLSENAVPAMHC